MKPETKLKKHIQKLLVVLQDFPKEKIPMKADKSGMDVEKFNQLPEIMEVKKEMVKKSIDIMGKNIINREYFQDQNFLVAALILRFPEN